MGVTLNHVSIQNCNMIHLQQKEILLKAGIGPVGHISNTSMAKKKICLENLKYPVLAKEA